MNFDCSLCESTLTVTFLDGKKNVSFIFYALIFNEQSRAKQAAIKFIWNNLLRAYFLCIWIFDSIQLCKNKKKKCSHKFWQQRNQAANLEIFKLREKSPENLPFFSRPFLHGALFSSQRRCLMVAVLSCRSDLVLFAHKQQTNCFRWKIVNKTEKIIIIGPNKYSTLLFHNG